MSDSNLARDTGPARIDALRGFGITSENVSLLKFAIWSACRGKQTATATGPLV
jgi:hypothetical protein